jgi:hypothetical protein
MNRFNNQSAPATSAPKAAWGTKPSAASGTGAKAAAAKAAPSKPAKSLSVKQGEAFINITGLWEKKTKSGETMFSGKCKEDGRVYCVLPVTDRKTGEFKGFKLTVSKEEGQGFETLATLEQGTSKAGNSVLKGKGPSGESFFVNDSKLA